MATKTKEQIDAETKSGASGPQDLSATSPEKSATPDKQKRKYQILSGTYWTGGKFEDGRQVKPDTPYGPGRPAGDIIESDVELDKRFNRSGLPPMYKLLGEAGDQLTADLARERLRADTRTAQLRRFVERMQVRDLLNYAESEQIDVKGNTNREMILSIVLSRLFTQ